MSSVSIRKIGHAASSLIPICEPEQSRFSNRRGKQHRPRFRRGEIAEPSLLGPDLAGERASINQGLARLRLPSDAPWRSFRST
jgi:hypothetical protein